MATTTNFGWETPDDTDLVKDGAAAIRTALGGVDTSFVDLKGGTTGQILSKASNTDLDYTWITNDVGDITGVTAGTGISGGGTSGAVTITNSMATEITAAGDIIVGTGSGTFDNLPIGTTGQVLTADTTVSPYKVKWASAAGGGGKVLQVVNATTSTNVTSATTTYIDTGLTATITPTLNTSKILVLVNQAGCGKQSSDTALRLQLLRGATVLAKIEGIGGYTGTAAQNFIGSVSSSYLDSPATTSATTYKTQMSSFSGSADSCTQQQSSVSTITLLEIGA